MRSLRPVFGLIRTLFGVLYCGGLLYYFLNRSGSLQEAETNGLGPTLLGLGAVGLVFCVVLIVKIVSIVAALRAPRLGSGGGANGSARGDEDKFDAEAVLARYMAQRREEALSPATPPVQGGGGLARRGSFGRKNR
jgi:hypothetical protein